MKPFASLAPAALRLAAALSFTASGARRAENWPQWRGPNGDGTSPVEWFRRRLLPAEKN